MPAKIEIARYALNVVFTIVYGLSLPRVWERLPAPLALFLTVLWLVMAVFCCANAAILWLAVRELRK